MTLFVLQWLRLEKPARSDVHIRVADSFDHSKLAELPAECSLLAVSNMWGLCFIGDEQCSYLRPRHRRVDLI